MAKIPEIGERQGPQYRGSVVSGPKDYFSPALERAGDAMQRVAYQQMAMDDAVEAEKIKRAFDDWEYQNVTNPETGAVTKRGEQALNLHKELPDSFDQFAKDYEPNIKSPRLRGAFENLARARRARIQKWSADYSLQQKDIYLDSEYEANVTSGIRSAAAQALNPNIVKGEIDHIGEITAKRFSDKGLSPLAAGEKARQATELAHGRVMVELMSQDRWEEADRYFNNNWRLMSQDQLPDLRNKMEERGRKMKAFNAVQNVLKQPGSPVAPTLGATDAAKQALRTIESGNGGLNEDGTIKLGPVITHGPDAGTSAKGTYQVTDSTARDPGYGIPPAVLTGDPKADLAEYDRVGEAKFNVMVKRYGGDLELAAAAMNWGEGNVDKISQQALLMKANGADWTTLIPEGNTETRNYITKFRDLMGTRDESGAIAAARIDYGLAMRQLEHDFPNDPEGLARARQELDFQWKVGEESRRQQKAAALSQAYNAVYASGGNIKSVPAVIMDAIPGDEKDTLVNFANSLVNNTNRPTDWKLWTELRLDPKKLQAIPDMTILRGRLSDEHYSDLVRHRESILNDPSSFNSIRTRDQIVSAELRRAGIDPTPPEDSKKSWEDIGNFYSQLDTMVTKSSTPDEIRKAANKLLAEQPTTSWLYNRFGKWPGSIPLYKIQGEEEIKRLIVPKDEEKKIRTAAANEFGIPPNEVPMNIIQEEYYKRLTNGR